MKALVDAAGVREGLEVLVYGDRDLAIEAQASGATVVAVDPDPDAVERARRREHDVEWLAGDAHSLEFEDDRFDAVLAVLDDATRPAVVIGELVRVCTPGGRIALAGLTGSPFGDEASVRELYAPRGVRLDVVRDERGHLLTVGTKTG